MMKAEEYDNMTIGQEVRTYLSGDGYQIRSGLLGKIIKADTGSAWVEHKVEFAFPDYPKSTLFWACIQYSLPDVEPYHYNPV